jgi:hypothetical protein
MTRLDHLFNYWLSRSRMYYDAIEEKRSEATVRALRGITDDAWERYVGELVSLDTIK